MYHPCSALPLRCVEDLTLLFVLSEQILGDFGDAVGEPGAGMNFCDFRSPFCCLVTHQQPEKRVHAALPGAPWQRWGCCPRTMLIAQKTITTCHRSS